MYSITYKKREYGFIIVSLMLCAFCVLKVFRGANTSVTTEGGIWNYISLFYYITAIWGILRTRTLKVKAIFVAPLLYSILSVLLALGTGSASFSTSKIYTLLMIPYFFLVFVSFYFYSDSNPKAEKIILFAYLACLLVNIYTIVAFLLFGYARALANDIYFSVCLFPFALQFVKHKGWKMVLIVAQFSVTFLSNKRAGFIALCIGFILYFLLEVKNNDQSNFIKVVCRVPLLVAMVYGFYHVSYYIDSTMNFGIYDRLNRVSTDQGSGRSKMYSKVWQAICESDWIEVLFGHGMNTAGKVAGAGYAHNDYLEVLYDYGVFPFVCIVIFVLLIICQAIKMIKRRSPYAPAFTMSVVIGITLSMFSYFLVFYTFVTCIMAFWGYAIKMESLRLSKRNSE